MSEKKEQDYGDKFLAGLMQLYCSNDLSDVVIFINNQRFPAHRAILATCSDYFRAMFTGGMKESVDNEQEVELHDMSMEGLKAVLEFMYTGKTTLNHRNSDTILAVANYLQVQPLVCLCISFLVDELVEENMMEVVALTTAYGLLEKFTRYEKVIDMFVAMVTRQDALLELSDLTAEQLMAFLQSKWMETHSPLQRFKVLVSWLERQNVTVKEDVINRAINYMPLNEMSVDDLLTHVKPVQSLDTEHCQQLIIDALVHHTSDTPVVVSSDHSYSVETEQVIVAIGGFETTNEGKTIKNYICYYDCHTNHWHKLSDMPIERLAYGAVLLNNHIYIVGGENYHCSDIDPSGCQFSTRTVYCFDLQLKQWRNVASMLESRTDFCVVTLHGYIYAIGGRNSRHPTGINSVERYDPSTNSWSYVAPLVRALFASAGAVYKDQIYISGGCFYTDRLIYTNALLYYNPKTNQWGEASAMSAAFPIAWHSMTSAGDKLYVLGGQQVELEEMDTKCSYSLKCYDPKLDRWSKCKDMPSHGSKDASCIINAYRSVYKDGKLYCIDGELTESTFIVQKHVHCYDIAQDAWSDGPCLPQDGFQSLVIANLSTYMIKHELTKTKTNRYQSCDANKTVELYELSTSYLSILVHILYNGRLPVGYHGNGLDDLLEAAEKLGLQAAVDVLKAHCSQNDMAV
ncbi:kelch-like protein 36 [Saccoglossus kowalevskii]